MILWNKKFRRDTSFGFSRGPDRDTVPVSGISYAAHIHGIAIHFKVEILSDATDSCFNFLQFHKAPLKMIDNSMFIIAYHLPRFMRQPFIL